MIFFKWKRSNQTVLVNPCTIHAQFMCLGLGWSLHPLLSSQDFCYLTSWFKNQEVPSWHFYHNLVVLSFRMFPDLIMETKAQFSTNAELVESFICQLGWPYNPLSAFCTGSNQLIQKVLYVFAQNYKKGRESEAFCFPPLEFQYSVARTFWLI